MRVCASVCVYVCTCGWEGGGGGSSDGVESVHEREDGVGGWRVYTDIGNNESWHRATLPSREKTICVCFVYMCVSCTLCMCEMEGRR